MTNAMILCAGLGTRLRPLTNELPKPLVWLGDRPALAHIAARLARGGVVRAVINAHHLAETFDRNVLDPMPLDVHVVHERMIRGTAGGVAGAAEALGPGDVIVWNGDIVADVDIAALRNSYEREAMSGAIAVLAVAPLHGDDTCVGEGTIGMGADGRVVRLRGEVFGEEVRGADYVGVQMIGASLRTRLPSEGCFMADVYLPALRRGERVATAKVVTRFSDLGTLDAYIEENLRWLADSGATSYVGESASIDPHVHVTRSIIGAGATVRGEGELRDVVVWPGGSVTAPLERAVVTTSGHVVRV